MWGEAALYEDEQLMNDIAYGVKSYMTYPIQKTPQQLHDPDSRVNIDEKTKTATIGGIAYKLVALNTEQC